MSFGIKFLEQSNIRSIDTFTSAKMILYIMRIKYLKDSLGGIITCIIDNPPLGLGEPCFNKLEAELAKAMLSIPSTKGFEIGVTVLVLICRATTGGY